jgi:hypothetical protein
MPKLTTVWNVFIFGPPLPMTTAVPSCLWSWMLPLWTQYHQWNQQAHFQDKFSLHCSRLAWDGPVTPTLSVDSVSSGLLAHSGREGALWVLSNSNFADTQACGLSCAMDVCLYVLHSYVEIQTPTRAVLGGRAFVGGWGHRVETHTWNSLRSAPIKRSPDCPYSREDTVRRWLPAMQTRALTRAWPSSTWSQSVNGDQSLYQYWGFGFGLV